MQKLKNNEARRKFTGSYKKERVCHQYILLVQENLTDQNCKVARENFRSDAVKFRKR